MPYRYSDLDRANLKWFPYDNTQVTLHEISLIEGQIRGLKAFQIRFKYPISVIAGKNGSGKSTILALAACAYHNSPEGFKLPSRKEPYYTFSDFFFQTNEEVPPEGIYIRYLFLNNKWKKTPKIPDGIGFAYQARYKTKGGKWNKYSRRVRKNVIFFGIERVVPHSEKSVSCSYKKFFMRTAPRGWEESVKAVVSKILGNSYENFWYNEYSKYHLPMVINDGITYSGFNMGAGENALFEIFSTIFACSGGALLVIDEIELGLHEEAQAKFIQELKKVCENRHIQIICTTHSTNILRNVPPEARFFIEHAGDSTIVTSGISPSFAGGKLAGENSNELDIFVEDNCAMNVVHSFFDHEIRNRVNIIPIGSASSLIRQLSARYKNLKVGECLGILDGDKRNEMDNYFKQFINLVENPKKKEAAKEWVEKRLITLPDSIHPELWILNQCHEIIDDLSNLFAVSTDSLKNAIKKAKRAEKHSEFYILCQELGYIGNEDYVRQLLCRQIAMNSPSLFKEIKMYISDLLD